MEATGAGCQCKVIGLALFLFMLRLWSGQAFTPQRLTAAFLSRIFFCGVPVGVAVLCCAVPLHKPSQAASLPPVPGNRLWPIRCRRAVGVTNQTADPCDEGSPA